MMNVPMRHQNWGPAGNTAGAGMGVGGAPANSGALTQMQGTPTPYPPQNNAPMAPPASPMATAAPAQPTQMAGNTPYYSQPQGPMNRPMGGLSQMQRPMMAQPMQLPQVQNWMQQQIPQWQQAYQRALQPTPQQGMTQQQQFQTNMTGLFNNSTPMGGLGQFRSVQFGANPFQRYQV